MPRGVVVPAALGVGVGMLAVVAVGVATSWWWPAVAASVVAIPGSVAAVVDVRMRRLPDIVVASVAAVGVFVAVVPRGSYGLSLAMAGAAACAAPLLVVHLASPGSIGFGDVKLGAALGSALGCVSADIRTTIALALIATAVAAFVGIVSAVAARRRDVPFGPALVVGAVIAVAAAERFEGVSSWR